MNASWSRSWERHEERVRTILLGVIAVLLVAVMIQRSMLPHHPHWTFPVFRASFRHLIHQQDLYAKYAEHDFFKYSPTAALLFAPFALLPFAPALLLWDALNAAALIYALDRLLPRRDATLALLLVFSELFISMQASQSNSLVAAIIVLAFLALERGDQWRGYAAIALGAAIKIFPLAALSLAIFHPRRARAALVFALSATVVALLPLTVTSPSMLLSQYEWWRDIESVDALALGASVMRVLHQAFGVVWPNWPVQAVGIVVLLLPLLQRAKWADAHFRRTYLASLLVFVVIFNHQGERPSFVIAATGVAIWFVQSPRDGVRLALVLLSLAGLRAWGYLPVWAVMQGELHGVLAAHARLFPKRDGLRRARHPRYPAAIPYARRGRLRARPSSSRRSAPNAAVYARRCAPGVRARWSAAVGAPRRAARNTFRGVSRA